ncbi:MAG: ABC transporter permease subunit [Fibromonadales bacterium]|nr:ABC transporter permease subunit [Fibromonadales bacterium]
MLFLREVYLIAVNSFREAVRDKIPYVVLFSAIALAAFTVLLGEWSVFDREFVVKSNTISLISLSGFFIAIFAGVGQVQKEIQKKTIHTLLAKPVSRSAFLLGKYFGLLSLIAFHVILLSLTLFFVLWTIDAKITIPVVQACYLVFCELAIVLAFAVLFSTYSSALISSLFSIGIFLIGHLGNQILKEVYFAYRISEEGSFLWSNGEFIYNIAKGIHYIFPNLYKFNASGHAAHSIVLEQSYLIWQSVYAIGYSGAVLCLAAALFRKKDFV